MDKEVLGERESGDRASMIELGIEASWEIISNEEDSMLEWEIQGGLEVTSSYVSDGAEESTKKESAMKDRKGKIFSWNKTSSEIKSLPIEISYQYPFWQYG